MEQARRRGARAGEGGAGGRTRLAIALAALGVSCFDGADALGLPCASDEECGNGQRCEQGFCGGPPTTSTSGTATITGPGSTGSTTSDPDSTTESTGLIPGCGNAVIEPELGEDCDPGTGLDALGCNADCTAAACGDGYVNEASGEQCDDGNATAVDDCTPDCRPTLFWDDMEGPPQWTVEQPTWTGGQPPSEFMLGSGWEYGVPEKGTWNSGLYSSSSGTTRLISPPLAFPERVEPGYRFELRFRHRLRFDGNFTDLVPPLCTMAFNGDGAVLWLMEEGQEPRRVGPPAGEGEPLSNQGCVVQPTNPLYDQGGLAYTGISSAGLIDATVPLPDVEGRTVRLVFEVGYDCSNCWQDDAPTGAGWTVDDVVVAMFPF